MVQPRPDKYLPPSQCLWPGGLLILRRDAGSTFKYDTLNYYECFPQKRSAVSSPTSGQSDQTFYFASVQITNTEIQEIRALVNHLPLLPD